MQIVSILTSIFKVYQQTVPDSLIVSRPKSDMCFIQFTSFREIKWPVIMQHKFSWTGTFLGNDSYLPRLTTWWTFSAHPSVHTSIHLYLQGPLRKQKTERILVLRGGSPPFYLKGRHKPYYLPVTATNYCWLPGSASTFTCMNGQTQVSLSFYKDLLLHPLTFTHSVSTSFTPLTPRCLIWQQLLLQTAPKVEHLRLRLRIGPNWLCLVSILDFEN